jgi:hypothetical protein
VVALTWSSSPQVRHFYFFFQFNFMLKYIVSLQFFGFHLSCVDWM